MTSFRSFRINACGILLVAALLLTVSVAFAAESTRGVLIFPIRADGVGLSDGERDELQRYLGVRLTAEGVYQVMPEAQVQHDLGEAKVASYRECFDEACRIELGKAVMADKSLSMEISTDGRQCWITATIFDLRREMSEAAGDVQTGCTVDRLRLGIKTVAAQLSHKKAVAGDSREPGVSIDTGVVTQLDSIDRGEKIVNQVSDEKGFVFIETNPAGADILINGEKKGVSPYQDELMAGRYVVVASLDDYYHISRKELVLTRSGAKIRLELMPAFGSISVSTGIPDAEVYIDGKYSGRTPYRDPRIISGTHQVEVRKRLYKSSVRTVTVSDGAEATEPFVLMPDYGSLAVSSLPSGAEVWVDGKNVGKTPVTLKELPSGERTVRIVKDLYEPVTKKVYCGDGRQETIFENLVPDFGVVEVSSDPDGAQVLVDGEPSGVRTPGRLERVKSGVHVITFDKPGYGKAVSKVAVRRDEPAKASAVLAAKLGTLSVTSAYSSGVPCSGQMMLDGEVVGETPWKSDVLAMEHVVKVDCGGRYRTATVSVPHNERAQLELTVGDSAAGAGPLRGAGTAVAADDAGSYGQDAFSWDEGRAGGGAQAASSVRSEPLYKKWWLWTIVGVVVAGTVAGVTAGVLTHSDSGNTLTGSYSW